MIREREREPQPSTDDEYVVPVDPMDDAQCESCQ
jgi:hypothetical protein